MGFFSGWIKFTTFPDVSSFVSQHGFRKINFVLFWSLEFFFKDVRKDRSTPSRLSFGFNFLIKL